MISQTEEHALKALLCLAREPGRAMTAHQIAGATGVPEGYLAKVLQLLGRAGLVRSRRGLRGGFTLSQSPAEVTVLAVTSAVDSPMRRRHIPSPDNSSTNGLHLLYARLGEAAESIERLMAEMTIHELMAGAGRLESNPERDGGEKRHVVPQ